ncbi:hypothetical protein Droror1_Dr00020111 [Drosera rotundifolia]
MKAQFHQEVATWFSPHKFSVLISFKYGSGSYTFAGFRGYLAGHQTVAGQRLEGRRASSQCAKRPRRRGIHVGPRRGAVAVLGRRGERLVKRDRGAVAGKGGWLRDGGGGDGGRVAMGQRAGEQAAMVGGIERQLATADDDGGGWQVGGLSRGDGKGKGKG